MAFIICAFAVLIIPPEAMRVADSLGRTNGTGLLTGFVITGSVVAATLAIMNSSPRFWYFFNTCIFADLLYSWHSHSWPLKQLISTILLCALFELVIGQIYGSDNDSKVQRS